MLCSHDLLLFSVIEVEDVHVEDILLQQNPRVMG